MPDPKALAQERFADPEPLASGIDVLARCATDPPRVVRGLVDAVRERVAQGGSVVELGFGSGWLLEELRAQLGGVSLAGLDLSAALVRNARDRYGDRVAALAGDMERLPFRDGAFDVVITCWTLYFMNDIDRALAGIARCLTPRGRLVVGASAPDHEAEAAALMMEAARGALGRDPDAPDIGRRFDLETGETQLRKHFARAEVRRWPGELVLTDLSDVMTLFPKWQPEGLDADEIAAVRASFERIAAERIDRDGELRIRRRDGAFVCDG